MSALSAALGDWGARHTITHDGRTYGFRPFGQAMKDAFQKELYRRYRERAARLPEVVEKTDPQQSAAALDARLAALERQFLAGGFEMESEAGLEFFSRAEGRVLLVNLIIERPEGDTDEQFAEFLTARGVEVVRLIDLVLCESMPGFAKQKARREAGQPAPPAVVPPASPVTAPPPSGETGRWWKKQKKRKKNRK